MKNVAILAAATFLVLGFALTLHSGASITPAVVYDLVIQCWDGSLVRDTRACPTPQIRLPPTQPRAAYEQPLTIEAEATPHVTPIILRQEKTLAQTLLEEAPESYVYSDGEHTIYAYKTHRSTGEWPFIPPGVLYWDTTNHDIFVYPGDISPAWFEAHHRNTTVETTGLMGSSLYPAALFQFTLTGIRDLDGQLLPKQFIKYFNFLFRGTLRDDNLGRTIDPYYVKSPYEYLAQFKTEQPSRVDTQERLLPAPAGTFSSNLSVHYKNNQAAQPYLMNNLEGKRYVASEKPAAEIAIRFNKKHVPLVIDELDSDGKLILRRSYTLQPTYARDGVMNTPVDPRMVLLPPHIIVTPDTWDDWLESQEN